MRLQVSGEYERYLKDLGMPPELSPSGDMSQTDLPANPETGKQMDLEAFAGSLSFGSLKVRGVHRQTEGGGVADLNPAEAEAEPSQEWKRSAAFMQVIARILLARRNKSRQQRHNLVELRKEVPDFPPNADLPRFPDELGTAEEFFEQWKEGYLDVTIRIRDRSNQEILFYSTGLREHEKNAPDEPDYGYDGGHWDGLKWRSGPES